MYTLSGGSPGLGVVTLNRADSPLPEIFQPLKLHL